MNTVFLPAAHASQNTGKAAARQKPDPASNAEDNNGFANVLADQATATAPAPSTPASSGQVPAAGGQPNTPFTANKGGATTKKIDNIIRGLATQSAGSLAQGIHTEDASNAQSTRSLPAQFQKILASLPDSGRSVIDNQPDQTQAISTQKADSRPDNTVLTTPSLRSHILQQADEHVRLPALNTDSPGHLAGRSQSQSDVGDTSETRLPHLHTSTSGGKNRHFSASLSSHSSTKLNEQMRPEIQSPRAETAVRPEQPIVGLANGSDLPSGTAAFTDKAAQQPTTLQAETPSSHTSGHSVMSGAESQTAITLKPSSIERPFSSPQWATNLGQQFFSIVSQAGPGTHVAELRLDPPQLGPLRITINLNDTMVQAVFTSAHASVRNAVEQALPLLQQQLEQEGLSLGQTSVGDHSQGSQTNNPEHSGARALAETSETAFTDDDNSVTSGQSAPVHQPAANALVDTFV